MTHGVVVAHVTHRGTVHAGHRRRVDVVVRLNGLPPKAPGPPPKGALLEHVLLGRVNGPVVTLARPAQRLRQLDEALVEGQVVAHRVLPALVGPTEKRELCLKLHKLFKYMQFQYKMASLRSFIWKKNVFGYSSLYKRKFELYLFLEQDKLNINSDVFIILLFKIRSLFFIRVQRKRNREERERERNKDRKRNRRERVKVRFVPYEVLN